MSRFKDEEPYSHEYRYVKVGNELWITEHGIWRNKHHQKERTIYIRKLTSIIEDDDEEDDECYHVLEWRCESESCKWR